jgi:mRNA interferase RelE/StbE
MDVLYTEEAENDIKRLPKELQRRIYEKIMVASENPYHYFVRLTDRPDYKLRIGDYRAIADIEDKIIILVIRHRKKVYDV